MSNTPQPSDPLTNKDLYKNVLDTRNFEITLFWQRSNYFLVLNSALAIGFFSLKNDIYELGLAIFGIVISVPWFHVNLGSKFWQSRWEQSLSEIEKTIAPNLTLFSADPQTTKEKAQESINNNAHTKWFERWIDRQVMKKPSVSLQMMKLSLLFIAGWAVALFYIVIAALTHQC